MPQPTSILEYEMLAKVYRETTLEDHKRFISRWHRELIDMAFVKIFRSRPYTDDMFQMLDDLGIEPPAYRFNPRFIAIDWGIP